MTKLGLLKKGLDYHLLRATMVIIFLFFGYQKWFDYLIAVSISFIANLECPSEGELEIDASGEA